MAISMVSAWATQNHLVLGQTKAAEKSNEITGCMVTIDALGTQTEMAKTVIEGGGDYLLAVKENQGHLFEDIQFLFDVDVAHGYEREHSYAKTVNKGHGRMETREC